MAALSFVSAREAAVNVLFTIFFVFCGSALRLAADGRSAGRNMIGAAHLVSEPSIPGGRNRAGPLVGRSSFGKSFR